MREAIHGALTAQFGANWYVTRFGDLDADAQSQVTAARARVGGHSAPAGRVIAALQLGMWTNLLGRGQGRSDYRSTFWGPALQGIWKPLPGESAPPGRNKVLKLANQARYARNRISHCEPVLFGFPQPGQAQGGQVRLTPHKVLDGFRALVGHVDPELGQWLSRCNHVDSLLMSGPAVAALIYARQNIPARFH